MLRRRAPRSAAAAGACLAAVVSLAAGGTSKQSLPPFPRISSLCHRADFSSQGRTVRAALCRPAGSVRMPAVVVLHGCGGFGGIDEVLARDLPNHGVATY
jgi:poly(3-hydroxybutyrate) depolymerase